MVMQPTKRDWIIAPPRNSLRQIIKTVAERHGLTREEIIGPRQFPRFVDARDEVVVELRKLGWSYPRIGQVLNRDHTTIINLARRHARRMAAQKES